MIPIVATVLMLQSQTPSPADFEGIWVAGDQAFFFQRAKYFEPSRGAFVVRELEEGARVGWMPLTESQIVSLSLLQRTPAGQVVGRWSVGGQPIAPPSQGYAYAEALTYGNDGKPARARFRRTDARSGAPSKWEVVAERKAPASMLAFGVGGEYVVPRAGLAFEITEASGADIKGAVTVSGKRRLCIGKISGGILAFNSFDPTTNAHDGSGFLVWAASAELVDELKHGQLFGADRVWMVFGAKSGLATFEPRMDSF